MTDKIRTERITYRRRDLVRLAKRDNNNKRPFLLVNPLQGKHIPCSPAGALRLFEALAERLYDSCRGERLLIVGFAETATAIGAAVAACSPDRTGYIQTTRENIPGADYLYFSESHSHATEQRLTKNRLSELLSAADRVIFAEDEVTTGSTILNAVAAIRREYASLDLKFGVVSILNGMTEEHLERFHSENISCAWLLRLQNDSYKEHLDQFEYDPALCFQPDGSVTEQPEHQAVFRSAVQGGSPLGGYCNPRLGVGMKTFLESCRSMAESAAERLCAPSGNALQDKDVLVLGTEEFMFPPLMLAAYLETHCGCRSVRFHATTRSPILPCGREDYPITSRYGLRSVYDPLRSTFIYNLNRYDKVVIIHDSPSDFAPGLSDLCSVLIRKGCQDISILRWTAEDTAYPQGGVR